MLNIAWMKGSGSEVANYFLGADYYLDEGQDVAWHGKFKDTLGLTGNVNERDLKALLNNRSPLGGKLTQRDSPDRRAALEAVFSAPKSMSIMHAIGGDERIRQAFDFAVLSTMQKVEADALRRVRAKGQDHSVSTGNLIYAAFNHRMGRPVGGVPDPQMHTHVLMVNATYDKNTGKWYALDGDAIKTNAPYYQAFFRNTLARQLQDMGYRLRFEKGDFEIEGVTRQMIEKFSNRSKQVNEAQALYGITNPESKAKLGAMTREKKTNSMSWDDLLTVWAGRLTPDEMKAVRDTYVNSLGVRFTSRDQSPIFTEQAMQNLAHKSTYVTERQLHAETYRIGIGRVTESGIIEYSERMMESNQWIRQKREGKKLSTRKALLLDIQVKDLWKAGLGKFEKLGRDLYTVKDPKQKHLYAIPKVMGSRDRFTSMRGSIGMKQAVAEAKKAMPEVEFMNNVPDGEMLEVMQKAIDEDKRIVFYGDKEPSRLEQDLNLKPILLYETPEPKTTNRFKEAIYALIQRTRDVFTEYREPEKRISYPEYGW